METTSSQPPTQEIPTMPENAAAQSLQPPLDEYRRQFAALRDEVRELTAGLDDEAFNFSPEPGRWSIGQCLAHLNAVDRAYARDIERGIAEAHERGALGRGMAGRGTARYNFFERWFIRSMEPPVKRRFRAPKAVVSDERHERDEVVGAFLELNRTLDGLLERSDDLDLGRAKMRDPFFRLLKLRIGAAFAILAAHDRRHLWQARQVRAHPDFPAAEG